MNFVPCLAWVAKGIAKSQPDRVQLQPEELKALIDETKEEIRDKEDSSQEDLDNQDTVENEDNISNEIKDDQCEDEEEFDAKYDLDTYDDDDDERSVMNLGDIAVYVDNNDDEYITDYDVVKEDEEEENDDFLIKENDNLLVIGHVEEDSSVLEIYVYNKDEGAFYVHHDIVLPAYPLALEWLDYHSSDEASGNYLALGDMTPVIKVWDLDVADVLEPDYCLGEKKKKKIDQKAKLKSHSDAVLSLSWNKHVRNILASGSADHTIVLWDLQDGRAANRLKFHSNKVQALQWSPLENSYLLSGCTDGLIKLYDCRTDVECKSWNVDGEVEKIIWDLSDSSKFFCSTDDGSVYKFDTRNDGIEHHIKAHGQGVTGLDICSQRNNILVTASMDKTIKLWNIENGFKLLSSQKLKVGSIYTAKFAPDSDLVLAVGGNNASNNLKIIDNLCETLDAFHVKSEQNAETAIRDSLTQAQSASASMRNFNSPGNQVSMNDKNNDITKPPKKKKKKLKHIIQTEQSSWNRNSGPSSSYNAQTQRLQNNVKKYE